MCAFDDFTSVGKSTVSNCVGNMLLRSLISPPCKFRYKKQKKTRLVKLIERPKNTFWTSLVKKYHGRK